MKHREYYIRPDRGKRTMLVTVARNAIRSGGIFLGKTAEGVSGAIRVWLDDGRREA